MKTVINIVLAACVIGLIYVCYGSIMGPINFDDAKKTREKQVIAIAFFSVIPASSCVSDKTPSFFTNGSFAVLTKSIKVSKLAVYRPLCRLRYSNCALRMSISVQ